MIQFLCKNEIYKEKSFSMGIIVQSNHEFTNGWKVSTEVKSLLQSLRCKLISSTDESALEKLK
jgi:hypothetical protein